MNKRDRYLDEDVVMIDGHRVKVPERLHNGSLEPSYGYRRRMMTPWGSFEVCTVYATPSLYGGTERYAQVYRPKTNQGVALATFRIT
jgi:hypothetical protein